MTYTAEQVDELLSGGSLRRVGIGARRVCHALPDGKLCVKCYRSDAELEEGKFPGSSPAVPLAPAVVREVRRRRFDARGNTNAGEFRCWERLRADLPAELAAVFPGTMELVCLPSRGWSLVEELVRNADGTDPLPFANAFAEAAQGERDALLAAFYRLADGLARYAVRFFDPQNVLVQRLGDGSFRLRIVDFEPTVRAILSPEAALRPLVGMKVRRRFSRYMEKFAIPRVYSSPISMSFSVSDNYSQHLSVVLASLLENNPRSRFVFHVLNRNVTPESESRIRRLERRYPTCEIRVHRIEASRFSGCPLPPALEHITQEAYYRYVLPEVLADEDRTIYSDVDVLCAGDMRPLWEMDLGGRPIAAVLDDDPREKRALIGLGPGKYFCSGMLLMDLAALRREDATRNLFRATAENYEKVIWVDQDIINIWFDGRIGEIPKIWNCTDEYSFFRRDVRQWHFQGFTQKPWCNIWKNVTWIPYLKYLLKTPYAGNAFRFIWGHVKGFFFFKYTKKQVTRYLVCGIRVWRRRQAG